MWLCVGKSAVTPVCWCAYVTSTCCNTEKVRLRVVRGFGLSTGWVACKRWSVPKLPPNVGQPPDVGQSPSCLQMVASHQVASKWWPVPKVAAKCWSATKCWSAPKCWSVPKLAANGDQSPKLHPNVGYPSSCLKYITQTHLPVNTLDTLTIYNRKLCSAGNAVLRV